MMAVPSIITLNNTNKMGCVSVNITDDNIVEGTETFYVQFSGSENNQIMIAGDDTVPVFIEDNEGKLTFTNAVFIMQASMFYMMTLCIHSPYLVPSLPTCTCVRELRHLVKHYTCFRHCNYTIPAIINLRLHLVSYPLHMLI